MMVRLGLSEKVTFDQILEGGRGVSPVDIWEKSISEKGSD